MEVVAPDDEGQALKEGQRASEYCQARAVVAGLRPAVGGLAVFRGCRALAVGSRWLLILARLLIRALLVLGRLLLVLALLVLAWLLVCARVLPAGAGGTSGAARRTGHFPAGAGTPGHALHVLVFCLR